MFRICRLCSLLIALVLFVAPAVAFGAPAGNASGLAVVVAADASRAAADHGLDVVAEHPSQGGVVLVTRLASDQTVQSLRQATNSDANVFAVDAVYTSSLQPPSAVDAARRLEDLAASSDSSGLVRTPCLDSYFADGAWAGWAEQSAATLTMVREAQAAAGHCGEGVTVAIIDTGVDASHPLLEGAVVAGYDFLQETYSLSAEWSGLDGTMSAIVENSLRATSAGTMSAIVEQSSRQIAADTTAGVNGTMSCIVETGTISVLLAQEHTDEYKGLDLPPLFGHGTMVAGLVRMVAPGAQILSLRAFDANGVGVSSDILRAIYFAVDAGADVINMSFSMERQSPAVSEALRYARANGVVVVAAAGNRGTNDLTYPASDSKVIGVASSDVDDTLAEFSNFGSNNADLAAPGVALISSFPGGLFAAGWGTSFSTPLVAGAAALLRFGQPDDAGTHRAVVEDILTGVDFVGLQGTVLTGGRLDVLGAVDQSLN